jgi:hypothetical protein
VTLSYALTAEDLLRHLPEEVRAEAEERFVAAAGTAAAISQVMAGGDALKKVRRAVTPRGGPVGGDTASVSELRRRIGSGPGPAVRVKG